MSGLCDPGMTPSQTGVGVSDGDEMTRAEQLAGARTQSVAWRVGRKIPRNLYAGNLDVGRMDTAELAETVVRAVNGVATVLALHVPTGPVGYMSCEHCYEPYADEPYRHAEWPCETARALGVAP